jgi:serine/threonine-protein kinase mTOR
MMLHYASICEKILKLKEFKDVQVRKTVIALIPHMAAYDPQSFCDDQVSSSGVSFLTTSMRHLLSQLKRSEKAYGEWC